MPSSTNQDETEVVMLTRMDEDHVVVTATLSRRPLLIREKYNLWHIGKNVWLIQHKEKYFTLNVVESEKT